MFNFLIKDNHFLEREGSKELGSMQIRPESQRLGFDTRFSDKHTTYLPGENDDGINAGCGFLHLKRLTHQHQRYHSRGSNWKKGVTGATVQAWNNVSWQTV